MPYRNSLRRGPPKPNASEAGRGASTRQAAAQTPKRNARTALNATKGGKGRGATRANERADNGDAHEPTGMTSDEDEDSESESSSDGEDEDDASGASEVSDSEEADGESDAFEPSASEQEVEDDIESVVSEDLDATPKGRKKAAEEEEEDDEDDIELEPGQKIVARIKVYPAPKTGQGRSSSCHSWTVS